MLFHPNASSKYYWSLTKTLLDGKKRPSIPPLFHNYKFVIDFKEKSSIRTKTLNSFFCKQCFFSHNGCMLPSFATMLTKILSPIVIFQ